MEAPVTRWTALAGVALGAGLMLGSMSHERVLHLSLHAPVLPHAIYLTAWDEGDVSLALDDRDTLPTITFKTRALVNDGCEWLGIEKLVPVAPDRFYYTYDETILSCEPGARPYIKTPRTGYVTVTR